MILKYDEMMLPILKIIVDGKEYNNSEIEDKLSKVFNLTDENRKAKHKSGDKVGRPEIQKFSGALDTPGQ